MIPAPDIIERIAATLAAPQAAIIAPAPAPVTRLLACWVSTSTTYGTWRLDASGVLAYAPPVTTTSPETCVVIG